MVRILPVSFRGFWGYGGAGRPVGGWDLRLAPDLLWPFAFGRPDELLFWGGRLTGGDSPLLFTHFPGLLALVHAAAAAGSRDRPLAAADRLRTADLVGASGPVLGWVFRLPGGSLLRFPAKAWLLVTVGASLLGGIGAARWLAGQGRRLMGSALAAAAGIYLAAWIALLPGAGAGWRLLRAVAPREIPDLVIGWERLRLAGRSLWGLLSALLLGLLLYLGRRHPAGALAAALALPPATQLLLLAPARYHDAAAPYLEPPAAAALIPPGSVIAQGATTGLLGKSNLEIDGLGERNPATLLRYLHTAVAPWAGQPLGLLFGSTCRRRVSTSS